MVMPDKTKLLLWFFSTVSLVYLTSTYYDNTYFSWYEYQYSGLSHLSVLNKFTVAKIEETCENNFIVTYTTCENETTIWPGNTITMLLQ